MNTADRYGDTRRLIDTHGWAVIGVFPTSAEDGPPFSYTVGLTDRGLPELAIYGLPPHTAHGVLNAAARKALDHGQLPCGEPLSEVLAGGLTVVALTMDDTDDLTTVRALYGAVLAAQQILWPDAHGRMPWQDWDLGDIQPLHGGVPT
ncbi:DUF4262 domain-containing protein [Mycolicibacterium palauense]|uniref:DUF4262 domain-containing protein n=1 Tax=Mycolicibacterium palauense TaxID=2034511 RepID=UPI000BFEEAE7|nr:DUF4262 domain-containing protein [Mycolicibacterium palauense]